MPRRDGISSEPGRPSVREKNGVGDTGVMEKIFEENDAPSGLLSVAEGISCAMAELSGRARPRMPSKSVLKGSSATTSAAAVMVFKSGTYETAFKYIPNA